MKIEHINYCKNKQNDYIHSKATDDSGLGQAESIQISKAGQRRLRHEVKTIKPSKEVVDVLIKYQGDSSTALARAAESGDLYSVRTLLDYGVNPQTAWGGVADLSLMGSNFELIKYLIEERKFSITKDPFSSSVCHTRTFQEDRINRDAVGYFLSKGYNLPPEIILYSFKIQTGGGRIQERLPKVEDLQYLVSLGAKSSFKEPELERQFEWLISNLLSIHYLQQKQQYPEIKKRLSFLLPTGNINFEMNQINNQKTPLLVAISYHDLDLANLMLESGADPNFRSGSSPLQLAIRLNNRPMIELLVNTIRKK